MAILKRCRQTNPHAEPNIGGLFVLRKGLVSLNSKLNKVGLHAQDTAELLRIVDTQKTKGEEATVFAILWRDCNRKANSTLAQTASEDMLKCFCIEI